METAPVLLIIFNRPDVTNVVFEAIRRARPQQLFIAADGPRPNKSGEAVLCQKTRQIVNQIDWPCSVQTLFRAENLGCKQAVSSAINWFFGQVEAGIILEDDCLPDPTFFSYCTELLTCYQHDERVMHIAGANFQLGHNRTGEASYYFSGFTPIWGWATWRRAWIHYDVTLATTLPQLKPEQPYFNSRILWLIQRLQAGQIDTWDMQWLVAVRGRKGLSIVPSVSLIRNIGFGMDATHTVRQPTWMSQIQYGSLPILTHPRDQHINTEADWFEASLTQQQPWYMRLVERVYYPLKTLLKR